MDVVRSKIADSLQVDRLRVDILTNDLGIAVDVNIEMQDEPIKVVVHPTRRNVPVEHHTAKIDMISGQGHGPPRCEMSCGHAISPDNLYGYCFGRLCGKSVDFRCQAFQGGQICDKEWTLDEIIEKGCLSEDEIILFQMKLKLNGSLNISEMNVCPFCGYQCNCSGDFACLFCDFPGKSTCELCDMVFCCFCGLPWPNYIVQEVECDYVLKYLQDIGTL